MRKILQRTSWLVMMTLGACAAPQAARPSEPSSSRAETITQWVHFTVRDDQVQQFTAAAMRSLELSKKEPGNVTMSIYLDKNVPHSMYVFSIWREPAALEYHNQQPYSQSLRELAGVALQEAPEVIQLTELTTP